MNLYQHPIIRGVTDTLAMVPGLVARAALVALFLGVPVAIVVVVVHFVLRYW